MEDESPTPDNILTHDQKLLIKSLSEQQLEEIDDLILSSANHQWKKVAMIVAITMSHLPNPVPGIPDIFYAQRVKKLVADGRLESQGNLSCMRFSEVRIANP